MSYGDLEEREDGHIVFPLHDPNGISQETIYARLLFDNTGIGIYVHRTPPQDPGPNFDRSRVMCAVYVEFYDGKVQAQIYDEEGQKRDNINYVCGGEMEHEESIVLVKNVEQWQPAPEEEG